MEAAREKAFVILDGTLVPIHRIAADTPYDSGKHKRHGMNVRVLTGPFGRLLWASPALPGAAHDLTAARSHGIVEALAAAGLKCWADKANQAAGLHIRVPFRGRRLERWRRRHNSSPAKIRCVDEQAMAVLKGWRLLRKLRCSTNRITDIVKAVLVLYHASHEVGKGAGCDALLFGHVMVAQPGPLHELVDGRPDAGGCHLPALLVTAVLW